MMTLALIVFGVLGYLRLGVDQFPNMELPVRDGDRRRSRARAPRGWRRTSPTSSRSSSTRSRACAASTLDARARAAPRSASSSSSAPTSTSPRRTCATSIDARAPRAAARDRAAGGRQVRLSTTSRSCGSRSRRDAARRSRRSEYVAASTSSRCSRRSRASRASQMFGAARPRRSASGSTATALRARGLAASDVLAALRREHVERAGRLRRGRRASSTAVKTDAEFRTRRRARAAWSSRTTDGAPVLPVATSRASRTAPRTCARYARYNGEPDGRHRHPQAVGGNTVAIVDEVYRRHRRDREDRCPTGITVDEDDGFIDFSRGDPRGGRGDRCSRSCSARCSRCSPCSCSCAASRPTLIVAAAIPISLIAIVRPDLAVRLHAQHDDAARPDARGRRRDRRRDRRAREHRAPPRGRRGRARGRARRARARSRSRPPRRRSRWPRCSCRSCSSRAWSGSFLREFGVTVAGSVMISLFVALTLTPMLAARMPPPEGARARQHLPPARAGVRRTRDELPARARLDARAPRRDGRRSRWRRSRSALVFGRAARRRVLPARRRGLLLRRSSRRRRASSLEATLEYPRARRGSGCSRSPRWPAMFSAVGRHAARGLGRPNRGHDVRHAACRAASASAARRSSCATRARRSATIPGQQDPHLQPAEMMRGGSQRGRVRDRAARQPARSRSSTQLGDALIERLAGARRLRRPRPEPEARPARAARDPRPREGRRARRRRRARSPRPCRSMIGGSTSACSRRRAAATTSACASSEQDRDATPTRSSGLYVRARDGGVVELRNLVRIEKGAAPSAITRTTASAA